MGPARRRPCECYPPQRALLWPPSRLLLPNPPIPRTALLITSRAVQAELRASELEFQRQMAEARKEMAAQQEREQMQRRVEIEEARKRGQVLATDHP